MGGGHKHSVYNSNFFLPFCRLFYQYFFDSVLWASLVAQLLRNLPEMWIQSLSWEDSLEKGKATHFSILAWRIPWTVQSLGLQRVGLDWVTFTLFLLLYQLRLRSSGIRLEVGDPYCWYHLYVESKNDKLREKESRVVVTRASEGGGENEMLVRGYKLPARRWVSSWGLLYSMVVTANTVLHNLKVAKWSALQCCYYKKEIAITGGNHSATDECIKPTHRTP